MAVLNVTYQGRSADALDELDAQLSDADIRRIAVELVRSGALPGLVVVDLGAEAFRHFVVDRFDEDGTLRLYLRPKVPFGSAGA